MAEGVIVLKLSDKVGNLREGERGEDSGFEKVGGE